MSLETKAKETELDIGELRNLLQIATRQKVKDLLGINIRKYETELVSLKEEMARANSRLKSEENGAAPPAKTENKTTPESQLKDYSWDQSEKYVKLYLTGLSGLADLDSAAVKIAYADESLNVRIENLKGKTLLFNIYKTCHKIAPEKCYHKVKSDYLVVFLSKYNPGSNWSHITYAEKAVADAKKTPDSKPGDVASDDPSAGLMNMMKKLYNEGDEDMKRTIAKAWTEGQEKKNAPGMDF